MLFGMQGKGGYKMISDAQKKAKQKYNQKVVAVLVEFYPGKDADIIETFKTIGTSRQEFIKKCIREVTNAKN